jgi:hypothetical protein
MLSEAKDLLFVLAQSKLREESSFPRLPLAPGERQNGRSASLLKDSGERVYPRTIGRPCPAIS